MNEAVAGRIPPAGAGLPDGGGTMRTVTRTARPRPLLLTTALLCAFIHGAHVQAADLTPARPAVLIAVRDGLVSAALRDAPLPDVLAAFAERTGIVFVGARPRDERLTLRFRSLSMAAALRRVLGGHSYVTLVRASSGSASGGARVGLWPERVLLLATGSGAGIPEGAGTRRHAREPGAERRSSSSGSRIRDRVLLGSGPPAGSRGGRDPGRVRLAAGAVPLGRSAVEALGRQADETVIAPLGAALDEEADPSVREAAVSALGNTWSEEAVEPLAAALLADGDAQVRAAAARALGETWSDDAVAPLARAVLEDASRAVREQAALAMHRIGSPGAVDALILALGDEVVAVRENAVRALGMSDDPEVLAALGRVTEHDPDAGVRRSASELIAELSR